MFCSNSYGWSSKIWVFQNIYNSSILKNYRKTGKVNKGQTRSLQVFWPKLDAEETFSKFVLHMLTMVVCSNLNTQTHRYFVYNRKTHTRTHRERRGRILFRYVTIFTSELVPQTGLRRNFVPKMFVI